MGAMGDVSPLRVIKGKEVPQAPVREQLRLAYRSTAMNSLGWAKSFGVLTALFGGVDCVVEKYRGKHDVYNPMISGCAVGATLSAKAGIWVIILLYSALFVRPDIFLFEGLLCWMRWVQRFFIGSRPNYDREMIELYCRYRDL